MKLLGAELANFACFDRQYVPLRDGISLFVGKNNAGKTAILRGLSALSAVTLGQLLNPVPNLAGYLRDAKSGGFDLHLVCQIDEHDSVFFSDAPEQWMQKVYKEGLARWRFSVTASGQVVFRRCTFQLPTTPDYKDSGDPIVAAPSGVVVGRLHFPDLSPIGQKIANPAGPVLAGRCSTWTFLPLLRWKPLGT